MKIKVELQEKNEISYNAHDAKDMVTPKHIATSHLNVSNVENRMIQNYAKNRTKLRLHVRCVMAAILPTIKDVWYTKTLKTQKI